MKRILSLASFLFIMASNSEANNSYFLETDPFAFVFNGYSLHVGKQLGQFRAQTGVFGIDIPSGMKANKSFDVTMKGYGIKVDYTGENKETWFVGIDLSMASLDYSHPESGASKSNEQLLLGARLGYRVTFGEHFYIVPWLNVSRDLFSPETVGLGEEKYEEKKWNSFATIHVGATF